MTPEQIFEMEVAQQSGCLQRRNTFRSRYRADVAVTIGVIQYLREVVVIIITFVLSKGDHVRNIFDTFTMTRLGVRNICYMLVATVCLLFYWKAFVPSKDYDQDQDAELVDKWIEKKLDTVIEKDQDKNGVHSEGENGGEKDPPTSKGSEGQKEGAQKAKPSLTKDIAKKEVVKNSPKDSQTQKPPGNKDESKKVSEAKKGDTKKTGVVKPTDTSKMSKEAWMAEMAKKQKERKTHLRQVCDTQLKRPLKTTDDLSSNPKSLDRLMVIDKHKFIYSVVYKVGSSNWHRVIVEDVEGFETTPYQKLYKHKALHWMPEFSLEEAKERLKNYTKFIFVRNPLSRILSAYKDKFVDHRNKVFNQMAENIIKMYRKGPVNDSVIDVTFPEFIEYLVNNSDHRTNPHWEVIFDQNIPCELDYDIIGKLEEADDDIPYVIEIIGIRNITKYGTTSLKKKGSDEKLWAEYYSQVPQDTVEKFYEIYKPDFILYGYDMPTSFKKS
ncbi:Carbohydrate sulfotransferase 11 [Holothuria leucospilota]|uniref:Carbohydrate sulfotransferase n=1 Tax=Holothuria leucospilota TaxID=206669 RepID=A0A9Q0YGW4_HOLLE|nr:Carbohydrate sulfotransferase 11 [Holothuria leucospilota]